MPYTDVKQYPYGSRLRHMLRVEVDNVTADPTILVLYFLNPSGAEEGPFTPTKVGQGRYVYYRTYTNATPSAVQGLWTAFWRGAGNAEGSGVRQFQIASLNIATSV